MTFYLSRFLGDNHVLYQFSVVFQNGLIINISQIKSLAFKGMDILACCKIYKNCGFIALMINLFVFLHYRNNRYGNEHYDKAYRYEIF